MKTLAAALLSAFLVTGGVSAALAQPGGSPAAAPTTPANPSGGSDKAPAASSSSSSSTAAPSAPAPSDSKTDTKSSTSSSSTSTDVRGSVKTDRDDSGSALPRSTTVERTTIFGLSPTAAVIIAAALLLVVILAIVAMTRSNDTYIDTNRRV
jgi:cobalamin biosynthesis Mg chelatase CobN